MAKIYALSAVIVGLAVCLTLIEWAPTLPKLSQATFVFASHRQLALKSCGCSYAKVGGIEAEKALFNQWKKDTPSLFNFTVGTSFRSATDIRTPATIEETLKANTLVRELNGLALTALAPTVEDLSVGHLAIEELVKNSSFPWISANLVSRSNQDLFQPVLSIPYDNFTVRITAISEKIGNVPMPKDFVYQPPIESLKKIVQRHNTPRDFWVVLSSVSDESRARIGTEVPNVRLLIAANSDVEFGSRELNPSLVIAGTDSTGRALGKVQLTFGESLGKYFSPDYVEGRLALMDTLMEQLEHSEQRQKITEKIKSLAAFPTKETKQTIRVLANTHVLTSKR